MNTRNHVLFVFSIVLCALGASCREGANPSEGTGGGSALVGENQPGGAGPYGCQPVLSLICVPIDAGPCRRYIPSPGSSCEECPACQRASDNAILWAPTGPASCL